MEVSAGICRSGKSRQISAVRSGSLQVDLYLPRLWAASRIKDFIWPDCESEVRSAAGRAASEHWVASAALVDVVASGAVAVDLGGMGSVCGGTCGGIFSN